MSRLEITPYDPFMAKITKIEDWDFPSLKVPAKAKNDLAARFLFVLALLGLLLGAWFLSHSVAEAKTIELKNCRTNKECGTLYLSSSQNYVQDQHIIKGCAGITHSSL